MAPKKASHSSQLPSQSAKRRKIVNRSVWNTDDDWQQIIADSSLSTASVSSRRALHKGLQSLSHRAARVAARAFKFLWDGSSARDTNGVWWKSEWSYVGDHMKELVRDEVFGMWGGYLRADMLTEVFMPPPTILLPGHLLTAVAQSQLLKPFRPLRSLDQYTRLVLTHAPKATDVAIAGLLAALPQLQIVNLKGCKLAGARTVAAMVKFCPHLSHINLKGTEVDVEDVKKLFHRFGQDLVGFKVDKVRFEPHKLHEVFTSDVYPNLTHLCLPGDVLNGSGETSGAKRYISLMTPVKARDTPKGGPFTWSTFGDTFPALTHLSLPGLLVPDKEIIRVTHGRLVKLSVGPSGPGDIPAPLCTVISLIEGQTETLEALHLGQIISHARGREAISEWERLEALISQCTQLKSFQWTVGNIDRRMVDLITSQMSQTESGQWNVVKALNYRTLKRLSIDWPSGLDIQELFHPFAQTERSESYGLEVLDLPSDSVPSGPRNLRCIRLLRNLTSLDVSGSSVTDKDLYQILDGCPFLHRINLTSCRGVRVQNRRNIFKAWQDAREAGSQESSD